MHNEKLTFKVVYYTLYMYDTYMYVGHTYNQKVFYSWCQRWEFSLILKIS